MFLQRLRDYSERIGDLGPSMYKLAPVRYEVQIDRDGNPLGLVSLSGGGKRDRGKEMFVPARGRSGTAAKPILLADRGDYAIGAGDGANVARNHAAFVDLIKECATATNEPDLLAVITYLERAADQRIPLPADYDPAATLTFSVAGRYPIDLPRVQAFWASFADRSAKGEGDPDTQCLVCGQRKDVVARLPYMIKGLAPVGGQTSGTALVSANSAAFTSYGLAENFIAPMCNDCAERVCKALNALIADDGSRLYLGSIAYVFWTREPMDFQWGTMLSQPEAGQVAAMLSSVRSGRGAATHLDTNAFFCAGLSGSGARVAVRDWIDTTVVEAQGNLARYFLLQRIVDRAGVVERYFGLRSLAAATVRDPRKDDPSPGVPRSLMRVALQGGSLPGSLLAQTVRRVQAGQSVSHVQAALIKMVLAGEIDDPQRMEDFMVELDESNRDPAYLCGRLLAVLDDIQRAALGQRNATIIDRFFGSASTAPISVFGRLVRGAQPHLAKLRRDRPGTYAALDKRMQEIIAGIGTFPRTLTLRQQGVFVLGYYHQRAADTKGRIERAAARRATGAPVDDIELLDELEG